MQCFIDSADFLAHLHFWHRASKQQQVEWITHWTSFKILWEPSGDFIPLDYSLVESESWASIVQLENDPQVMLETFIYHVGHLEAVEDE